MSARIIEIGMPEALRKLQGMRAKVLEVVLAGMRDGANEIVSLARTNAMAVLKSRTGTLINSLQMLDQSIEGNIVKVQVGSNVLGYPFFQEFGWTTRAGTSVPPKLFLTNAVETVRPKIPEYITARLNELAGG
jgi:hypothetical protein